MIKERKRQTKSVFSPPLFPSCHICLISLSSSPYLSPPTSSSFHQSPSVSLTWMTMCSNTYKHAHTRSLTATIIKSRHTAALLFSLLFCLAPALLLNLKKNGTPSCLPFYSITCCLTISAHPSPPGRLDYISALVRPEDVFTQDYEFHFLSIHPSTLTSIRTSNHQYP